MTAPIYWMQKPQQRVLKAASTSELNELFQRHSKVFAALNAKLIHNASTQCKHLASVKVAVTDILSVIKR
ncbi:hypothetical protein DERF_004278 [Dermatophagoides farinae]|uniref:Uncharacterized protein n=1 Tax=Dermatophagoides farinae TaxID=6954 RepID=A0A922I2W5_DERFA|nr:hypothetical protein DERF_004278 [Dermatophagoides farinae]